MKDNRQTYDIYGIKTAELNDIAAELSKLLSISWTQRHSLYIGDYYQSGRRGDENFTLQYNFHDEENEWMLPQYKEYQILLYVNATNRAENIQKSLSRAQQRFVLLQRQTTDQL